MSCGDSFLIREDRSGAPLEPSNVALRERLRCSEEKPGFDRMQATLLGSYFNDVASDRGKSGRTFRLTTVSAPTTIWAISSFCRFRAAGLFQWYLAQHRNHLIRQDRVRPAVKPQFEGLQAAADIRRRRWLASANRPCPRRRAAGSPKKRPEFSPRAESSMRFLIISSSHR